jgi:hypothetical protein
MLQGYQKLLGERCVKFLSEHSPSVDRCLDSLNVYLQISCDSNWLTLWTENSLLDTILGHYRLPPILTTYVPIIHLILPSISFSVFQVDVPHEPSPPNFCMHTCFPSSVHSKFLHFSIPTIVGDLYKSLSSLPFIIISHSELHKHFNI